MSEELTPSLGKTIADIVREAGRIILEDWNKPRSITHKGRIDLVTKTDIAVEAALKRDLSALVPGAQFLAEESAVFSILEDTSRPLWIIDPLDGTTNFAHGFPLVAISVALRMGREMVFGCIHVPVMGETFTAIRGQGAFLNGQRISVSTIDSPVDALVGTGFPYIIREVVEPTLLRLKNVLMHTQGFRRPGSAAIDLAYLACGRLDAFYETNLKPWDTAAGMLLVEEAGGRVSRFDPNLPYRLTDTDILASNAHLHSAMAELLKIA